MYDVMAIGNALVDHEYVLSDAALEDTALTKGNMTLVGLEEQQELLAFLTLQISNLPNKRVVARRPIACLLLQV